MQVSFHLSFTSLSLVDPFILSLSRSLSRPHLCFPCLIMLYRDSFTGFATSSICNFSLLAGRKFDIITPTGYTNQVAIIYAGRQKMGFMRERETASSCSKHWRCRILKPINRPLNGCITYIAASTTQPSQPPIHPTHPIVVPFVHRVKLRPRDVRQ